MNKLTLDQWQQLTREEKREALIAFKNPDQIYYPDESDKEVLRKDYLHFT